MRDVEKKKRINKRGTLKGIAGFIGYPIKQLLNSKQGKQADNKLSSMSKIRLLDASFKIGTFS